MTMITPTPTQLLLEVDRHPAKHAAGVNLFQVLEHMIGGRVAAYTLRREPGDPPLPRVLVAILCLEGVEALVKTAPALSRAEREAVAAAAKAVAAELELPELPAELR